MGGPRNNLSLAASTTSRGQQRHNRGTGPAWQVVTRGGCFLKTIPAASQSSPHISKGVRALKDVKEKKKKLLNCTNFF